MNPSNADPLLSALPGIADAHAKGEISNGQLGAVAAIAATSSEAEALELAKTGTSTQLHQRAAASRGKLFEERCKAQKGRYLVFKPEEDGQSTRIHGRLPFAESKLLETQLRKIADRIGLCDKERPSPSARMADALLILTKNNPSQALHDHEEQANQRPEQASDPGKTSNGESSQPAASASGSTTRPKLYALTSLHGIKPKPVIDYDEDPFPEINSDTVHFGDTGEDADRENSDRAHTKGDQPANDLAREEPNNEDPDEIHANSVQPGNNPETTLSENTQHRSPIAK